MVGLSRRNRDVQRESAHVFTFGSHGMHRPQQVYRIDIEDVQGIGLIAKGLVVSRET